MKIVIALLIGIALGATAGLLYSDYEFRKDFEALTAINWYSFNAAHADCEKHWNEKCRIYGGFAPKSQFMDE